MPAPFQGVMLTRMHLRRAIRNSDAETSAALTAALNDSDYMDDLTADCIQLSEAHALKTGLAGDWMTLLMQFLVTYGPDLIKMVLAWFNKPKPPVPPTPVPPVPVP